MSILTNIHEELGIGSEHLRECRLEPCAEPPFDALEVVGIHFDGRPFILERRAAAAWRELVQEAGADGVVLVPFSGFRSYLHQKGLITRKLEKGQPLATILTSTAIPGFSEHHTGRAVDICVPERLELEERFEETLAFGWLGSNAARFGFRLSYPRGNAVGIVYEPWHWCFVG